MLAANKKYGFLAAGDGLFAKRRCKLGLSVARARKGSVKVAAKVAAKTGATAKATKYYETLLSVDPDNADAKAFLAKQAADEGGGADSPPAEPSEGG